jgi:serine/threonine protein kinase
MDSQLFTFVFHPPDGQSDPRSLRDVLLDEGSVHSLSERFRLASELAKAVSFVHVFGFVHKNVRPEAILLFKDSSSLLGSAYLVGFEKIRNAAGHTVKFGEASWQKDLYHHSSRQGAMPEEVFLMQHDIYSLGVCLLEIGLWQSFVTAREGQLDHPNELLRQCLVTSERGRVSWDRIAIKDQLLHLAEKELPQRMGTRFAGVVMTCFTCLDRGGSDFGDEEEFQDEDGIVVGVRFIEKVRDPIGLLDLSAH